MGENQNNTARPPITDSTIKSYDFTNSDGDGNTLWQKSLLRFIY